jgi:hypothetical protein
MAPLEMAPRAMPPREVVPREMAPGAVPPREVAPPEMALRALIRVAEVLAQPRIPSPVSVVATPWAQEQASVALASVALAWALVLAPDLWVLALVPDLWVLVLALDLWVLVLDLDLWVLVLALDLWVLVVDLARVALWDLANREIVRSRVTPIYSSLRQEPASSGTGGMRATANASSTL